jgi:integrase
MATGNIKLFEVESVDLSRQASPQRPMIKTELLGKHTHHSGNCFDVHIYKRQEKYLARFRLDGEQRSETLGITETESEIRLRRLITELEDGVYQVGRKKSGLPNKQIPNHTFRTLMEAFLKDVTALQGNSNTKSYYNRLLPILDFIEQGNSNIKFRYIKDLDRPAVLAIKSHLEKRLVPKNGHPNGKPFPATKSNVRLALETLRTMLNWGKSINNRQLPADFVNPVTGEIIPPRKIKDPYRPPAISLELMCKLIANMDAYQLIHLSPLFLIPMRHEDSARALISDVIFTEGTWHFGDHFNGDDQTKEAINYQFPIHPTLTALLKLSIGNRSCGPLFLSRRYWEGRKNFSNDFQSETELRDDYRRSLQISKCLNLSDRKSHYLDWMERQGGLSKGQIARELRKLFEECGIVNVRPYDLKGTCTHSMVAAGMSQQVMLYLTGHKTNSILNEYAALNILPEAEKYFDKVSPVLKALADKALELNLIVP